MNGRTDLISEQGQGSTFSVVLPWRQQGSKTGDTASGKPEVIFREDQLATRRFAGMRALVVDDHLVNAMLLEKPLSRLGYAPRMACGRPQATRFVV